MKPTFSILLFVCLSMFVFSCQKETDGFSQTTKQNIEGKWQIDSVIIDQQITGSTNYEVYQGKLDEYIDFKPGGQMTSYLKGKTSNSTYKIRDNNSITIDGDTGYIQELTDRKFKLNTKAQVGSIGFIEVTYFLSK